MVLRSSFEASPRLATSRSSCGSKTRGMARVHHGLARRAKLQPVPCFATSILSAARRLDQTLAMEGVTASLRTPFTIIRVSTAPPGAGISSMRMEQEQAEQELFDAEDVECDGRHVQTRRTSGPGQDREYLITGANFASGILGEPVAPWRRRRLGRRLPPSRRIVSFDLR